VISAANVAVADIAFDIIEHVLLVVARAQEVICFIPAWVCGRYLRVSFLNQLGSKVLIA
jgi:hypothetical protein